MELERTSSKYTEYRIGLDTNQEIVSSLSRIHFFCRLNILENICEVLGFSAENLPHGLVRWKEKKPSKGLNVTENYKLEVIPDEQKIYKVR